MFDGLIRTLNGLPPWQAVIAVLALSLGGAALVQFVGFRLAKRLVARTETQYDEILLTELRLPIVVSIALGGLFVLTNSLPGVVAALPFTTKQITQLFDSPARTILILVWAWALNQLVNRLVEAVKDKGPRYDFAPVFSNVWTLFVIVGAIGSILAVWNVEITPLLGAAGIAGITIGFAAKDTVANFFGGIALYFDDTYKIGDYITIDSGEAGTVVKVGIRSTTLLTRDEVLVTVPNAVLNAAKIINQSAPQRRKRIRVPIGVAYGTDIDVFEELAVDVAVTETLVLDSPEPRIRFRRFGDSALEYELLCWVRSPTQENRARHNINRELYKGLREIGIEIPFPKRDVRVTFDESSRTAMTATAEVERRSRPVEPAAGDEHPVEPTTDGGRDDGI